jgi:ABC-type glycerol-3-phosphate transport system permease component
LFNFYFAFPIFFNMTVDDIQFFFTLFPSFISQSVGAVGLYAFFAETAFWNTLQGIIDLSVASVIGGIVLRRIGRQIIGLEQYQSRSLP